MWNCSRDFAVLSVQGTRGMVYATEFSNNIRAIVARWRGTFPNHECEATCTRETQRMNARLFESPRACIVNVVAKGLANRTNFVGSIHAQRYLIPYQAVYIRFQKYRRLHLERSKREHVEQETSVTSRVMSVSLACIPSHVTLMMHSALGILAQGP